MAYVLLTNLIITSALKATVTLNFRSSILLTLEIGLRFGFGVKFEQSRLGPRWGPRWGFAGHRIRPFWSAGYGIGSKIVAGLGIQISLGYGIGHKMIAGYGIQIPSGNEIRSEICSVYPKWLFFTILYGK